MYNSYSFIEVKSIWKSGSSAAQDAINTQARLLWHVAMKKPLKLVFQTPEAVLVSVAL